MTGDYAERVTSRMGMRNQRSRPYRKYRPLPAVIVIAILCVGALGIWLNAILSKTDINEAIRCEPPTTPSTGVTRTSLQHDALNEVVPAAPRSVAVKVLNAGTTRGQASITTEGLRVLGFEQVAAPENDPVYQSQVPRCRGQIRFGPQGTGAARTMSLLVPCAELVRDTRPDATIELAIGDSFGQLQPNPAGQQIVQQLNNWANSGTDGKDGEQAPHPVIDKELLVAARNVSC